MRLEHLQYLVEIDNQRSITRAAKMLYTTQPALSVVVSGLERELGFPIFRRTKQGVEPTTKGEKVIAEARGVLNCYRGWQALAENRGEVSGDIHVILTPVVGKVYLPDAVAETKRRYPQVQFYLDEVRWNEALQALSDRKNGLLFFSLPEESLGELENLCQKNDYTCVKLGSDAYQAIISTQNPLAGKEELTAEDICEVPFIMYMPPNDRLNDKLRQILPPGGQRYMVNNNTLIWELVARGMAVSTAPASDLENNYFIEKGLVKMLPLKDLEHCIHHVMVYSGGDALNEAERCFVRVTQETLGLPQP